MDVIVVVDGGRVAELGTEIVLRLLENDCDEEKIELLLTVVELSVVEDEFCGRLR